MVVVLWGLIDLITGLFWRFSRCGGQAKRNSHSFSDQLKNGRMDGGTEGKDEACAASFTHTKTTVCISPTLVPRFGLAQAFTQDES